MVYPNGNKLQLIGADKPDSQLTGIISLISHPAVIPETHADV